MVLLAYVINTTTRQLCRWQIQGPAIRVFIVEDVYRLNRFQVNSSFNGHFNTVFDTYTTKV